MAKVIFASGSRSWANNLNDLRERWHIRREEPVKFVVPVDLFKQDLQTLSREYLLKLKIDLFQILNNGKKELVKHHNIKREEGVYLQADKYSDLFFTIQAIKVHILEVERALSRISQQKNERVIEHFMDICRERLSKEQYFEFMNEANDRHNRTE